MSTVHGLLRVLKPTAMTSHDVVSFVRRALRTKEVGHTGTLDPLASGLMVLVLGEGTKISDYILNGDKAYRVKVKLGLRTDSLDITGQVQSTHEVLKTQQEIRQEAERMQGEFNWPVPLFSAAKKDGKKLYEWAHKGEEPPPNTIPVKEMKFWDLKILGVGPAHVEAHLRCSKGSFIRTWASELGDRLECGGVVEELERTESSPYRASEALALETLAQDYQEQSESWKTAFTPLHSALPDWKAITVKGKDERLLFNGQISYDLERRLIIEQKESQLQNKMIGVKVLGAEQGQLLAILEAQPHSRIKIRRVFKRA